MKPGDRCWIGFGKRLHTVRSSLCEYVEFRCGLVVNVILTTVKPEHGEATALRLCEKCERDSIGNA